MQFHNTLIIHRAQRTDRIPAIARVMGIFPDAKILEAKVPDWEQDQHARAVRGCSISHLSAVKAFRSSVPVLILEDDAIPVDGCADIVANAIANAPKDAAAILLGSDVTDYGDADANGFREPLPPFFGSHAVLYLPNRDNYLLSAFEHAATMKLGSGQGGICLESLLYMAAGSVGLRLYRPEKMAFTTIPGQSDSRGNAQPARDLALTASDRSGLLPPETWEPIFSKWSGKKAHLLTPPGNAGDELIRAATHQILRHYNIAVVPLSEADVVMYHGGANISGQYPFFDRTFEKTDLPKIVLPHTLHKQSDYVDLADEVWVRDETSLQFCSKAKFLPDLALGYRPSLVANPTKEIGKFFRLDAERTTAPADNIGDPAASCRTHYEYLRLAGQYKHVHTNRLHFAIAALLMGNKATLYGNSYHKCKSIFPTLAPFGCEWGNL